MNTTARAAATDGDERSMLPDGGGGGKVPRKENAWLAHVKAYREVHPGLSYKEVLEKAGETYKKVVKKPKVADGDKKPNPWMMHIARWKEAHPNWKETASPFQQAVCFMVDWSICTHDSTEFAKSVFPCLETSETIMSLLHRTDLVDPATTYFGMGHRVKLESLMDVMKSLQNNQFSDMLCV